MSKIVSTRIAQVRWRLNVRHFLSLLVWMLSASLTVGCVVVLVDRLVGLDWSWGQTLLASIAAGLVLATIGLVVTRRTAFDAAVELDRAFGLKERVSTMTSLDDAARQAPAGQALAHDVDAQVSTLVVAAGVPIALPRYGWLPLAPLTALVLVGTLVEPRDWLERRPGRAASAEERQHVVEQAKAFEDKIAERKEAIADGALDNELKEVTDQIDRIAKQLSDDKKLGAKAAALKLSDLAKSVEEQRQKFDAVGKIGRALQQMQSLQEGPAKDLAKALKRGDFQEAAKQLSELQKKLAEGKLAAAEKQQVAKQLQQLQKQLEDLAKLTKRMEQLKQSLPPEQLQKELAKLMKDAEKLQKLKELAEKLGRCSQCMGGDGNKPGDNEQLQQALADAEKILDQLQLEAEAAQMIDQLLDDLAQCQGGMCEGKDRGRGKGDFARGKGIGEGYRDEAEDKTRSQRNVAKTKTTKGPVFYAGQADAPNFRGDSKAALREAVTHAARAADDAITRQKVPREYQTHAREYFQKLNQQTE